LAALIGGRRVFGSAIAVSAFLNLLIPGAATMGPGAVIIVRILQGLVEVFIPPFTTPLVLFSSLSISFAISSSAKRNINGNVASFPQINISFNFLSKEH
jgi:hypothetical protein